MKKRAVILSSIILLTALPVFFLGCAVQKEFAPTSDTMRAVAGGKEVQANRMFVRCAGLTLEVDNVRETVTSVASIVEQSGGYIENNNVRGNGRENAYLKIRVPSDDLPAILDRLAGLGKEKSRFIASEDVTEQYIDTEARLKNAVALRDRLRALLDKARDVKDILDIERELTRIQSEIDSMEARRKKLKGEIDYAAIDLSLEQKKIPGPLGYLGKGIAWLLKKLFVIR